MSDPQNPNTAQDHPSTPSASGSTKAPAQVKIISHKIPYPNPPDATNPDPATLREQWRFAIKQYSRWYSHAWGTAILAGLSFFALGWIVKGSNPLPSFKTHEHSSASSSSSSADTNEAPR